MNDNALFCALVSLLSYEESDFSTKPVRYADFFHDYNQSHISYLCDLLVATGWLVKEISKFDKEYGHRYRITEKALIALKNNPLSLEYQVNK